MIEFGAEMSIRKQAELLNFERTSLYYKPVLNDDSATANLIRDAYLSSDCRYGYRKITAVLHNQGNIVNRKKIKTTFTGKENKIYPYLLKDLKIERANHVWATDITYIKMNGYFMYFIAIIDLYSRYIIGYDLSNSLEASFCIRALIESFENGMPEIFNTDQGSQFTDNDFVKELNDRRVKISMDHTGRCFDNIFVERLWRTLKQEAIYYYRPESIVALEECLKKFVFWYNNERLHQSLKYKTPADIYFARN